MIPWWIWLLLTGIGLLGSSISFLIVIGARTLESQQGEPHGETDL